MSQENLELSRRALEAFNGRDWEAIKELADDGVVIESRLVGMEGGYHGHDGLQRWWDDLLGAFPDYRAEIIELRDLGDVVLGHMRGLGHSAVGETPIVDPFWQPSQWRDGRCVWWRNCSTEAEALNAIAQRKGESGR